MPLYKIACILLILSAFIFVHAAPVAVQEIRETRADAVDGGNYLLTGSGKRSKVEGEDPLLAQSQQEPSSSTSDSQSTPSQHQGSSLAPNYPSGTHPNPSFSSGGSKPPLSTSGVTELSRNPEGEAKLRTWTIVQPASSSKAKLISWAPWREVIMPSGHKYLEMLPPDPKIKPLDLPLEQIAYLDKMTTLKASSSLPPEKMTYLDKMATLKALSSSPPKPQSKNFFIKLGKLIKLKLKFWRRISGTVDDVVTDS